MALLKKGSKGKPVNQLQTALNKKGAAPKLKIDGIFGPKTETGVKGFQKKQKLKVDGLAGEMTLFALGIGNRPKKLELKDITPELTRRKKLFEHHHKNFYPKYVRYFAELAKGTEDLKKALIARGNMVQERGKASYKEEAAMLAKANKEIAELKKAFEKTTDPAKIAELNKKMEDIGVMLAEGTENYQDIVNKMNGTIKDMVQYNQAVAAIKSKVEKINA